MTTRQELLDQWRNRLIDAEAACEDPDATAWTARFRRKLYRFLLAMYATSRWPGPKDDVDNEAGRALNHLLVAEPKDPLAGKEPRTRAQILKSLSNVKGLSEELAPPGPLAEGLRADSPMVVAAFKKRGKAQQAVARLQRAGLEPTVIRNAELFQVFIAAGQAAFAVKLLRSNPAERPRDAKVLAREVSQQHRCALISLAAMWFVGLAAFTTYVLLNHLWNRSAAEDSHSLSEDLKLGIAAVVVIDLLAIWLLWAWWQAAREKSRQTD